MLAVLRQRPVQRRVVVVSFVDGRRKIVEDNSTRDSLRERPGGLERGDCRCDVLAEGDGHVHVPAEDQHHHERPGFPKTTCPRFGDAAQISEVHLRHLAWLGR
jgi:hypothetical protein